MHTDELQTPTGAGPEPEPEGLVARARAVHALVLEQRRLDHEAARARFREENTELLRRRLQALGVDDPAIAWDPDAGAIADVEGLRFGLDDDEALVLGRTCARCTGPMVSPPIEDLDDLGALLEREGDWPWHECPADEPEAATGGPADASGPEPASVRPPLRLTPDDARARRDALWKLHHDTAVRVALSTCHYVEATQAADEAMADICWDVLVEANAAHQVICAALDRIKPQGAQP
jgi:hypothetical protein